MQTSSSPKGKYTPGSPPLFYIIFILVGLFSALGLDYVAWKKGEKSYLFYALARKEKVTAKKDVLSDIILSNVSTNNIPPGSINQFRDSEGINHFMIDLSFEQYTSLESLLKEEFQKVDAFIIKKEEQKFEEKNYYLWEVKGKKKQRLTILFSCLKERLKTEEKPSIIVSKNKVAIIIDDMGQSLKAINDICSINQPITVAILPYSPLASETAGIARQNNLEVILHIPMESINNIEGNNSVEGIILSKMSEEEIIETVEKDLDQVPYIIGVNNHMGSKITADKNLMRIILERIKLRNLFFVDSRTTGKTVAYNVARSLKIPTASRQVFLDSEVNEGYIERKLHELFRLARKNGKAIGICHPFEETLKVLKENILLVEKYNLQPVFVSQIVE